jgi:hypothetical protein
VRARTRARTRRRSARSAACVRARAAPPAHQASRPPRLPRLPSPACVPRRCTRCAASSRSSSARRPAT